MGAYTLRNADERVSPKPFCARLDLLWLCFGPGLACVGPVGVALLLIVLWFAPALALAWFVLGLLWVWLGLLWSDLVLSWFALACLSKGSATNSKKQKSGFQKFEGAR